MPAQTHCRTREVPACTVLLVCTCVLDSAAASDLSQQHNFNVTDLPLHAYGCPHGGTAIASVQPILHMPTWSQDTAAAASVPALAAKVIPRPYVQVVPVRAEGELLQHLRQEPSAHSTSLMRDPARVMLHFCRRHPGGRCCSASSQALCHVP